MLLSACSYYPHYGPAGTARRRPRPDSARAWPNPAISLFFTFPCFLSAGPGPGPARRIAGADNDAPESGQSAHCQNAIQFEARSKRRFEALAA